MVMGDEVWHCWARFDEDWVNQMPTEGEIGLALVGLLQCEAQMLGLPSQKKTGSGHG